MSDPLQKFLVGQRVFWQAPCVDWKKKSNLFVRAQIVGCLCRFPGMPLAQIVYKIRTDEEVWSETEWNQLGDEDLFLEMPVSGKIWNRTKALRKPSKKKKKKKK